MQGLFDWEISMIHEKASTTWDSTPRVTRWFEKVEIARKSFKVLSKGEGQATAWRPKDLARVKKKYLYLVKAKSKHIGHIEVVDLNPRWHMKKVTWCVWKSSHKLKMAMLKE
jgi:hypothetical protein